MDTWKDKDSLTLTMKSSQPITHKIAANLVNKLLLLWQRPDFLIGLMTIIYLAIGLLVVTQYGKSVDESPRMFFAGRSLAAYSSKIDERQDEKGPFYSMLALLGSKVLARLIPGWKPIDGWHYMTFVSFVIGVYFFYRLCRRLIDLTPAIAATLLFGTQPLVWGHAFINPKDIPFMAFFLASVSLGLEMVDHLHAQLDVSHVKLSFQSELPAFRRKLAGEWASASGRLRRLLEGLGLLLVALGLSCRLVQMLLARLVSQAYSAPAESWLGRLFRGTALLASQIPVQNYISKAQRLYSHIVLLTCIGLALACVCVALMIFSSVRNRLARIPGQPQVLLASCFLGFCSDIRTLGPASGLLVAVYFLYKCGRKAIPFLIEYLGLGALTIYIFWPYLWRDTFNRFWSSLSEAAKYPWTGQIMFAGKIYSQENPPSSYLPVLFTLQFTETAMALIAIGIILAGFYMIRRSNLRMKILLLGVWSVAPVAAAILLHSTVYNNFRQFLFVVPPLFVFAGLALQALWNRLKRRGILFVPLILLMLLPGLYWDWQLHPYQYIYYNSLVGGVAGASRDYDTDYWNIAYKEAIEYVNRVAPKKVTVSFWSNSNITEPYARHDLKLRLIAETQDPGYPLNTLTDYAVITTEDHADQFCFPDSKEIFTVQRGGAVLAVVKQVEKGDLILNKNAIQWEVP